jgi:hypothetical protein
MSMKLRRERMGGGESGGKEGLPEEASGQEVGEGLHEGCNACDAEGHGEEDEEDIATPTAIPWTG